MDKTEQELADRLTAWRAANPGPNVIAAYRGVAKSLLQENAKLTAQRDEWEATAVERQQLCDHWAAESARKDEANAKLSTANSWFATSNKLMAEGLAEKDARIKELETALATGEVVHINDEDAD